jgi:hypothetical protein
MHYYPTIFGLYRCFFLTFIKAMCLRLLTHPFGPSTSSLSRPVCRSAPRETLKLFSDQSARGAQADRGEIEEGMSVVSKFGSSTDLLFLLIEKG